MIDLHNKSTENKLGSITEADLKVGATGPRPLL